MCQSDIAWRDPILIWGSEMVTGMGNRTAQYAPIFPHTDTVDIFFCLKTEHLSYIELIDSLAFPLNA